MPAMLPTRALLVGAGLVSQTAGLAMTRANPASEEVRSSHETIRVVEAEDIARSFADFKQQNGRTYQEGTAEHELRRTLFEQRQGEVQQQNAKQNRKWTATLNLFSDRTAEELKAAKGWRRMNRKDSDDAEEDDGELDMQVGVPNEHSWLSTYNAGFIRDQGGCGSCWAVTASTVLGFHSEIHATNQSFSTQEIVDCVPNPDDCGGTGGCEGATVELAFQYAMLKGLREPQQYGAYTATDGQCDWTINAHSSPALGALTQFGDTAKLYEATSGAAGRAYGMTGWQKLKTNKESPLLTAVFQLGPVAIALAANDIMSYSHGVFDTCTDWTVNHAVTLVGYGSENGDNYWLVQNSWGASWGEGGRIKIGRTNDEENNCGMDTDPQAGLACKGDTDPVQVCGTCGILFDSVVPIFKKA